MRLTRIFGFITLVIYFSACGNSEGYAPSLGDPTPIQAPVTAPSDLVITSPAVLSAVTNTSLTITGQCQNGTTVFLEGDDAQSVTCAQSEFSFVVSKTSSSSYFLNLYQSNAVGSSSTVTVSWAYDILAPATIVITSPLSNPYTSGDASISISGNCETGTTVNIAGDHTSSTDCISGSFIFTDIAKGLDGSYVFNLTQTDLATNVSTAKTFTWVRDTTLPATPTITNFSDNPHYTNTSPLTVEGACVSGNTVTILEAGVVLTSGVCAVTNTYSLNVAKGANGTYTLAVYQTDAVSLNDSAYRDFTWVYDSVAPAAPTIANPTISPVTSSGALAIAGACETDATVNLTGDDVQATVCAGGSYSFNISEAIDGTYNYTLTQTDLAGNISASTAQQWIKDSTVLPTPTIDTPGTNPFLSNLVNLVLSGQCQNGLTVQLSGVLATDVIIPAGSLTLPCSGSQYSFTLTKVDGTYPLSVNQTDGVTTSISVSVTWTKDTVEPNTTLTSTPPGTNYSNLAEFVFSADEAGSFECSLDASAYSTCVSPLIYDLLANSSHTLNIRAIDAAGNVESTPATYTWTQASNNTVALYHFDAAAPMLDSSNYVGGSSNTLTDNASVDLAVAQFAEGRTLSTSANYVSVADTPSQQAIASYLTLESWVKLNALPGGNTNLPIISKINGATQSFEYGIKKQGANYTIYFKASLNGTSNTEKKSATLSAGEVAAFTAGFNHIAVTWNLGTVKFYLNGVVKGSAVIGTAGSSKLASSASPLRIGYNGSVSLNGSVDEARISQTVRWNTGFTPSVSAYTAD